eukprot:TRINITY_DN4499_c0_g1_i1.p1 TRINITY_DN4499_c0_g1~~TRINITY_DN4499_c0_g1_i1.p1  ORF type:complete len:441 (+),score=88.68 TRINITY_DN4499_c0_g1_i1:125-1447(+)
MEPAQRFILKIDESATLLESIDKFKSFLRNCFFKNPSYRNVIFAYHQFQLLNYPNSDWEKYIKDNNIYCWNHLLGPKICVGAELFYPREIVNKYDTHKETSQSVVETQSCLARNDVLWAFGIAAKFGSPLGYYYLYNFLRRLCEYSNKYLTQLVKETYEKCYEILERNKDNVDALYLLGLREFDLLNIDKAIEYFEKGWSEFKDKRCKTFALVMKIQFNVKESNLTRDDVHLKELLDLKYSAAAICVADLYERKWNDLENAIEILLDSRLDAPPEDHAGTFIKLGMLYSRIGNTKRACDWFFSGAEFGMAIGAMYLVEEQTKKGKYLTNSKELGLKLEHFQDLVDCLKSALETNDPFAYYHYFEFCSDLKVHFSTDKFDVDIVKTAKKISSWGFDWGFDVLTELCNFTFEEIVASGSIPSDGTMFKYMIQELQLPLSADD